MPRATRPWFRLYVETFGDRKIRRLTPTQRWLWVAILGAARTSPSAGRLLVAHNVPMTYPELADYADVRLRDVAPAVDQMVQLGMLHWTDDNVLEVSNWGARQYESDDVTARTRDHRERSKERSNAVPSNVRRNAPETETETETEPPPVVAAQKRAARITEDWQPTADNVAWARAKGMDDVFQRRHTERFRNHWLAAGGSNAAKRDWSRAWMNWLDTELDRTPKPTGSTPEGMPW